MNNTTKKKRNFETASVDEQLFQWPKYNIITGFIGSTTCQASNAKPSGKLTNWGRKAVGQRKR